MIRNKCDGNIFQWDTNLILDVPASDIVYVDFQHDEIIRVAVEDGSCRIPDEILETAGKKILWLCHDDQTREQFIFNVKARPMPPDHIVTPTQRITFDSLVRDVRTSIEEADIALGAMMAAAEREVGDKMSSVDEKMQQVDADVSDALESVQEATERAEDASEGAERVNVESERVDDGVLIKTTDREGHQTVTMVRDGQGGEGGSGMVEHKLTYTGSAIQFNGVTQTFAQVKDACLNPEKFVFVVYQNRLYIPQYVYNDRIFFTCTYQTDSSGVVTRRIKLSSNGAISVEDVELATSAALEDLEDQFTGVTEHMDAIDEFTEGLGDAVAQLNTTKLEKPSSGIEVGKYFRVASIDDAGNPVLEAVDLPNVLTNASVGTQAYSNSSGTYIATRCATDAEIESRDNNRYKPIPVARLRTAVDSVLCSTNANEALTPAQQAAAQARLGISGGAEKPWVLKATWTDPTQQPALDLTGCKQLLIMGSIQGTAAMGMSCSFGNLHSNAVANGFRRHLMVFEETQFGVEWIRGSLGAASAQQILNTTSTGYSWFGKTFADIRFLKFPTPANVTSVDIQIYAR